MNRTPKNPLSRNKPVFDGRAWHGNVREGPFVHHVVGENDVIARDDGLALRWTRRDGRSLEREPLAFEINARLPKCR